MLPSPRPPGPPLDKQQRRLLKHYRTLSEADQYALLRYAQFLADQPSATDAAALQAGETVSEPRFEPAPEGERVIAAIQRLGRTYFMIDKDRMLHETADLMTQHLAQGRPAKDVITALEALFSQHYQALTADVAASGSEA